MTDTVIQTPPTTQTPNQATPSEQSFVVPEAYHGKPWVEKVKSTDDLWKTLDNAQGLIGRKTVPSPDAPDEEWQKFYNTLGRPEAADKYALPEVEGLPDGADLTESKKLATSIMHEAGLTQKQAEKLWKLYVGAELQNVEKTKQTQAENAKKLDAEFDETIKKLFGDKHEEKQRQALDLMKSTVPEDLRSAFDGVAENPKALAAVVAALAGAAEQIAEVKRKYGAEDGLTNGGQSAGGMQSMDAVRKELAVLRTSEAARDFMHKDHKATMDKIKSLSDSVQRSLNKA